MKNKELNRIWPFLENYFYFCIIEKIKQGKAHELSEGDTMYLGACRKGQKGENLMKQPYNPEIDAPRRAFSLKMAYMRTVLGVVVKSGKNAVSNVPGAKSELVSANALLIEVSECNEWIESRLYELFSSRFMFVVFKEQTAGQEDYVLEDVFFWTMPQKDLEWAEVYWNHIMDNILSNHISEEFWWKGADKKKFHVRPKAQKAVDLAPTPDGKGAKNYYYWFNNDYIREIVENRQKEKLNG